jgi:hypothetical protein
MSKKHEPEATKWERMAATLGGVADRSTGWVAARVKDTFQDFVGRVLYGETVTPEPSDKWDAPERDDEPGEKRNAPLVGKVVIVLGGRGKSGRGDGPDVAPPEPERGDPGWEPPCADREDPGMDR